MVLLQDQAKSPFPDTQGYPFPFYSQNRTVEAQPVDTV